MVWFVRHMVMIMFADGLSEPTLMGAYTYYTQLSDIVLLSSFVDVMDVVYYFASMTGA